MTLPLLKTKLFIPPLREQLIPRPHLIKQLEAGLKRKLTLISAPAGFGKTTLLCEWIYQSAMPFAWITLEKNDNDIVRFLAYFIAALRLIKVGIGEEFLSLLRASQKIQMEAVLIPLINQITHTKDRFALVLDDYHLIESPEIHEVLTFLLEHQPPIMHLIIAGRSDPPLPLARLRGREDLTELRAASLRFTLTEGDVLINQGQRLNLSRENVQRLINRTEGWVVGLQMAAIALQRKEDPSGFVSGFTGSHEYIADFLADEVMSHQSDQVQEFLLTTSILDRLSGQSCDAVTGQANSHQILKQLRSSNLFVSSLDDEGQWFRYHRLFADLLQQRLLESQADIVPTLYIKASDWFAQNGFFDEAIEYALRSQQFERSADLIKQVAEQTVKRSEIVTFIRWVDRLPDELVRCNSKLSIYYAWALLVKGERLQLADSYLKAVIPENEHIYNQLNAVQSLLATNQKKYHRAVELSRQAIENLPVNDLFFRNLAAWNLSAGLYLSGDQKGGEKALEMVAKASRASGNLLVAVVALCRLAAIHLQHGELRRPKALYQQALDLATDDHGQTLPIACEAMIGLGNIYWEGYTLETAENHLLAGTELSKRWREQMAIDGYVVLAHIYQTRGDIALTKQMIEKAKTRAARTIQNDLDDDYVALHQAHLWIRQGDLQAAEHWASEHGLNKCLQQKEWPVTGNVGSDLIRCYESIVFARLLIVQKRSDEAHGLLNLLLPFVKQEGILRKVIEIRILQAIGAQTLNKIDAAVSLLTTAVTLAQPEGHIRPFLDEGSPLIKPLKKIAERGIEVEFVQKLLDALSKTPSTIPPQDKTLELIDPLSEREMEVLHLLQTNLTVPEIAENLYLATSTVRSHVKNDYSKLSVHSRFEAVSKAEACGLL